MTTRIAIVGLVLLLAGCRRTEEGWKFLGEPNPRDRFVNPTEVLDFAVLYEKNCRGCHGPDGAFGAAPPLNDAVFLAIVDNAELTNVITNGRPGTSMPPFAVAKGGTLTDKQIAALVAGVRGFAPPAPGDWPPYPVPKQPGDAARGRAIFERACAKCHGDDGKGTAEVGAIHDSSFLALSSEQFLRRMIITGRADLGMPNCKSPSGRVAGFEPLTDADVTDLTALLTQWKTHP